MNDSQVVLQRIYEKNEHANLEPILQNQYQIMTNKMMSMLQNVFSQESVFYQNNMELRNFLEKQKNSNRKGKESEDKLQGLSLIHI